MFKLGQKTKPPKLIDVPEIKELPENNTREGFVENDEYNTMKEIIPFYLKGPYTLVFFRHEKR